MKSLGNTCVESEEANLNGGKLKENQGKKQKINSDGTAPSDF